MTRVTTGAHIDTRAHVSNATRGHHPSVIYTHTHTHHTHTHTHKPHHHNPPPHTTAHPTHTHTTRHTHTPTHPHTPTHTHTQRDYFPLLCSALLSITHLQQGSAEGERTCAHFISTNNTHMSKERLWKKE